MKNSILVHRLRSVRTVGLIIGLCLVVTIVGGRHAPPLRARRPPVPPREGHRSLGHAGRNVEHEPHAWPQAHAHEELDAGADGDRRA